MDLSSNPTIPEHTRCTWPLYAPSTTGAGPDSSNLGYEASHYTTYQGCVMFFIKQPQVAAYQAILGIDTSDEHTLAVNFVDMTIDTRQARPRLRQLMAAFWTSPGVGRDLAQLRRILFQNVTEKFTRDIVRDRVAGLMGVGYSHLLERPHEDIILDAPSVNKHISAAEEAWNLICAHSRLVRSVMGLLREFPMAGPDEELAAVQIVICPAFDQAGNAHNFDLAVVLGHRRPQEMKVLDAAP